jgi:hypothetical protein
MLDEHELDSDAGRKCAGHVCPHSLQLTGDWIFDVLTGEQRNPNPAGAHQVSDPPVWGLLRIGDPRNGEQNDRYA